MEPVCVVIGSRWSYPTEGGEVVEVDLGAVEEVVLVVEVGAAPVEDSGAGAGAVAGGGEAGAGVEGGPAEEALRTGA